MHIHTFPYINSLVPTHLSSPSLSLSLSYTQAQVHNFKCGFRQAHNGAYFLWKDCDWMVFALRLWNKAKLWQQSMTETWMGGNEFGDAVMVPLPNVFSPQWGKSIVDPEVPNSARATSHVISRSHTPGSNDEGLEKTSWWKLGVLGWAKGSSDSGSPETETQFLPAKVLRYSAGVGSQIPYPRTCLPIPNHFVFVNNFSCESVFFKK